MELQPGPAPPLLTVYWVMTTLRRRRGSPLNTLTCLTHPLPSQQQSYHSFRGTPLHWVIMEAVRNHEHKVYLELNVILTSICWTVRQEKYDTRRSVSKNWIRCLQYKVCNRAPSLSVAVNVCDHVSAVGNGSLPVPQSHPSGLQLWARLQTRLHLLCTGCQQLNIHPHSSHKHTLTHNTAIRRLLRTTFTVSKNNMCLHVIRCWIISIYKQQKGLDADFGFQRHWRCWMYFNDLTGDLHLLP